METIRERILRLHKAGRLTDAMLYEALSKGYVQAADVTVAKPTTVANAQTIKAQANAAMQANRTYLALTAPTTAQNTAQIKRLTQECQALIRLALNLLDGTD